MYPRFRGELGLTQMGRPLLVNLWSTTCAPCLAEFKEFADNRRELEAGGLNIVALCVDQGDDAKASATSLLKSIGWHADWGIASPDLIQVLDALQRSLLGRKRPLPVPTSFLVNGEGRIVAIYKGRTQTENLLGDLQLLGGASDTEALVALPFRGRWFDQPKNMSLHNQVNVVMGLTEVDRPEVAGPYLNDLSDSVERAPELDPLLGVRFANLGVALSKKRDWSGSIKALRRAVRLNPDLPRADYDLDMSLLSYSPFTSTLAQRGELDEAIGYLRRAVQNDPQHFEGQVQLAMVLFNPYFPDDSVRFGMQFAPHP